MGHDGFTHERHGAPVEWYTPPTIFERLGLQFDVDVASPGRDKVPWIPAAEHLTRTEDGLRTPWHGRVWLNPPYDDAVPRWLKRFIDHGDGMALVFARTDTKWFHEFAVHADLLCFMRGRVRFVNGNGGGKRHRPAQGAFCSPAARRAWPRWKRLTWDGA